VMHTSRHFAHATRTMSNRQMLYGDGSNLSFVTDIPKQRGAHRREWAKYSAPADVERRAARRT
jgi:hypothetical protein